MTELVLNMEKSNKDYQEEMDTKLNDISMFFYYFR